MSYCDHCSVKFTLMKRKKTCSLCGLKFCSSCAREIPDGSRKCHKCLVLTQWPIDYSQVAGLRVRDLRHFLQMHEISSVSCTEKGDLVALVLEHLKRQHHLSSNYLWRCSAPDISTVNSQTACFDDGIRVRPTSLYQSFHENLNYIQDQGSNSSELSAFTPPTTVVVGITVSQSEDVCDSTSHLQCSNQNSDVSLDGSSSPVESMAIIDSEFISSVPSDLNSSQTSLISSLPEINLPQYSREECTPNLQILIPEKTKFAVAKNKLRSINSEEEIKLLSVITCKEILTLHRVDFSGITEKEELIEKVTLLWRDTKRDLNNLRDEDLCKICMDNAVNCVLLECGHVVACIECGRQLSECPICRQFVVRAVRIFHA